MNINLRVARAIRQNCLPNRQDVVQYLLNWRQCPQSSMPPRLERFKMQRDSYTFLLSVLFIKDQNSTWVAQCLEFDIAAQGKTIKEAQKAFERTFLGQVGLDVRGNRRPLEGIEQAPKEYWDMFESAVRLADRKPFRLPADIPPAFMIAAAEDLRVWG